jgi:hypothetical protein
MPPSRAFREGIAALFPDASSGRQARSERGHALYQARSEIVHGRPELGMVGRRSCKKRESHAIAEGAASPFGGRPGAYLRQTTRWAIHSRD